MKQKKWRFLNRNFCSLDGCCTDTFLRIYNKILLLHCCEFSKSKHGCRTHMHAFCSVGSSIYIRITKSRNCSIAPKSQRAIVHTPHHLGHVRARKQRKPWCICTITPSKQSSMLKKTARWTRNSKSGSMHSPTRNAPANVRSPHLAEQVHTF